MEKKSNNNWFDNQKRLSVLNVYIEIYWQEKFYLANLPKEIRQNMVETLVVMVESDWERSDTVFIKANMIISKIVIVFPWDYSTLK